MSLAISGTTGITLATQFDSASTFAFKNRLINGQMQIAQRGTTGSSGLNAPTTAPTYPSVDRWYAYSTVATVTVAQVAGTGANRNNLQVSGAGTVTSVGVGQRIEALNSYDLAGSTCTLSVNISNSLLTTVTWTASYATSADTWSAKTQIATGTFTVSGTLTNYSAQISVPAAATTGIEILFTVGAQTSGTWVIGNAQLEKSSIATTFDYRPYGTELALCQRYLPAISNSAAFSIGTANLANSTLATINVCLPVSARVTPTGITTTGTFTSNGVSAANVTLSLRQASPLTSSLLMTYSSGTLFVAGQASSCETTGAGSLLFTGCEL